MADSEAQDAGEQSFRNSAASDVASPRGSKRMRYTSVACAKCKKRKVKCDGRTPCTRCKQTSTDCIYAQRHNNETPRGDAELASMNQKIELLQHQIGLLVARVGLDGSLLQQAAPVTPVSTEVPESSSGPQAATQKDSLAQTSSRRVRKRARESHYMGLTSSTFGFEVARKSLQSMGIPTDTDVLDDNDEDHSTSPAPLDHGNHDQDPLLLLSRSEALELVQSYEEESGSIYPFLNMKELIAAAESFYDNIGPPQRSLIPSNTDEDNTLSGGILDVLKLAIAIASVIKDHGPTPLSVALLESVESGFDGRLCGNSVDMLEMQAWTLMSILQFNCNQEILAWRTIGLAGRAAVEMGLHQREPYFAKFHNHQDRLWANKLFWCIYVLDRRCSFATGLPFVINDLDIDPELPEPDDSHSPILKALVSYGHIASRVWKATSKLQKRNNKTHKIEYLHFQVQQWQKSLATEFQLDPAMPDMLAGQSRALNKIRVLLYLHANQMCLMLYRHTLMSPTTITKDPAGSTRVVEVATDSIRVLDKLHRHSDIFSTQQASFNYFLVSGLAVLFLAICHAPTQFNEMCREEFFLALNLIRQLSANSYVARRLWKTVKHLKTIGPKLGILPEQAQHDGRHASDELAASTSAQISNTQSNINLLPETLDLGNWSTGLVDIGISPTHSNSVNGNQISYQLTNIFEAMEPKYTDVAFAAIEDHGGFETYNYGTTEDLSRSLLGLF